MKTFAILILLFGSVQAYATRQHCEPRVPTPREPVSKPEPKAEPRAQRDRSDHDRPCDGTIKPFWCPKAK